jgi:hypothetical protein
VLEKYTGRYEMSPEMIVAVTLENGKLYGQGTGQGKTQIFAASETEFFLKNADVQITFDEDEGGNVVSMTLLNAGRKTVARKIKGK